MFRMCLCLLFKKTLQEKRVLKNRKLKKKDVSIDHALVSSIEKDIVRKERAKINAAATRNLKKRKSHAPSRRII